MKTLLLAGSRPGTDPLLAGTGLESKALLPIGGTPMLAHVLHALRAAENIGEIIVAAQDVAPLAADPAISAAASDVTWRKSENSIAGTVLAELRRDDGPMIVTTGDNVLLTPEMVDQFLCASAGFDVSVGMTERRTLEAAGYSSARTWLKFRGGQWSGANLFYLGGADTSRLVQFWSSIEQDRKKGMRIVGALGPGLLAAAVLRLIDIHGFAGRVARRFGLRGKVVPMLQPEACIDADKAADIPVIEAILASRQAAASALSTAESASASSSE